MSHEGQLTLASCRQLKVIYVKGFGDDSEKLARNGKGLDKPPRLLSSR
jgi:hypothetical protein